MKRTIVLFVVLFIALAGLTGCAKVLTITQENGPIMVELQGEDSSCADLRIENKACYPISIEMTGTTPYAGENNGFNHTIKMKNEEVIETCLPLQGNGSEITIVAKTGMKVKNVSFPDQIITIKR